VFENHSLTNPPDAYEAVPVHICRGTNRYFRARTRCAGARKCSWIGPRQKSMDTACKDMVRQWGKGHYHEADVIMCADYYDPVRVIRMHVARA